MDYTIIFVDLSREEQDTYIERRTDTPRTILNSLYAKGYIGVENGHPVFFDLYDAAFIARDKRIIADFDRLDKIYWKLAREEWDASWKLYGASLGRHKSKADWHPKVWRAESIKAKADSDAAHGAAWSATCRMVAREHGDLKTHE